MKKINIIVVDDNRLLREGISSVLEKIPEFKITAKLGAANFIRDKVIKLKSDIVLVDIGLTIHNSFELVRTLLRDFPKIKVIVLGILPTQEDISQFIEAGVTGFFLKESTTAELIKTIRSVAAGEKILPPKLSLSLFNQIADYSIKKVGTSEAIKAVRMTKREREIVKFIAEGKTNREIAHKLNLSIHTVKSHIHNILEKLALNNRIQLAIYTVKEDNPPNNKY